MERENFWTQKLETLHPEGLNQVKNVFFVFH